MEWQLTGSDTTCGLEAIASLIKEGELGEPKTCSATDGVLFVLTTDNQLSVFYGSNSCIQMFPHRIDDVAILHGGFLAVAEESGAVTVGIIEILSSGEITFKEKQCCNLIPNSDRGLECGQTFSRISLHKCSETHLDDLAQLVCVTLSGFLLVFSEIKVLDGDLDLSSVKIETARVDEFEARDMGVADSEIYTVGTGDVCIVKFSCQDGELLQVDQVDCIDGPESLNTVAIVSGGDALICLEEKGGFHLFDTTLLLHLKTWTLDGCIDFRLVETKFDQLNFHSLKFIANLSNEDGYKVQLLNFCESGPRSILEQAVSPGTKLGKSLVHQDEIYTSEWKQVDDEDGRETTVFYRCYTEIDPKKKIERLISKKKFIEAQKLAKLHGLDYNLVPHIVEAKMRLAMPTLAEMKQHLAECEKELQSGKEDIFQMRIQVELKSIKKRFKIYEVVSGGVYAATDWEMFQHENPFTLFCQQLTKNANSAFVLWDGLRNELQAHYQPGVMSGILGHLLPSTVSWRLTSQWITSCVVGTSLMTSDPDAMRNIVDWTEEQIGRLEQTNGEGWIEEALELCDLMLQAVQQDDSKLVVCSERKTLLARLHTMNGLLTQSQELRSKFNFRLSLYCLSKETKEKIAHRMLNKVVTDALLQPTLQKQVLPYIRHCKLNADAVFASYVKELFLQLREQHSIHEWELKAKTMVDVINSPKEKVTAVMGMLEHSPLPIPETVTTVVNAVIASVEDSLTETLVKKWRMKEADNLLRCYGIQLKNRSPRQTKLAAKNMVVQDHESSLKDARKLLAVYQVDETDLLTFWCHRLIEKKELETLKCFLRAESPRVSKRCLEYIVGIAEEMMCRLNPTLDVFQSSRRLAFYEASVRLMPMLDDIVEDVLDRQVLYQRLDHVRHTWILEIHYNIQVNSDDIFWTSKALDIFTEEVTSLSKSKLFGLSEALGMPSQQAVKGLFLVAIKQTQLESYRVLFKKMIYLLDKLDTNLDREVFDLVHSMLENPKDTTTIVLKILRHITCICRPDVLPKVLHFCSNLELVHDALCRTTESGQLVGSTFCEWGDQEMFEEKSRSLRSQVVLEDVLAGLLCTVPVVPAVSAVPALAGEETTSEDDNSDQQADCQSKLEDALSYLQSSGHDSLAYRGLHSALRAQHWTLLGCDANFSKLEPMANQYASSLLSKTLAAHPVDMILALGYLFTLPSYDGQVLVQKAIRYCGSNYKRLKGIAQVALIAAEVSENENLINSSEIVRKRAKWGNRLRKIRVEVGDFSTDAAHLLGIVDDMIKSSHCDIDVLLELFNDYEQLNKAELDSRLKSLLETHLSSCSGPIELKSNCGPKTFIPKFSTAMAKKANRILSNLGIKYQLNVLKTLLKKTSPYDYEILDFILQEIMTREDAKDSEKHLELLRYLKVYNRISTPGELETGCGEEGSQATGGIQDIKDVDSLPAWASTRLPFHALADVATRWKVVQTELSPDTLDHWVQMSPLLSISIDDHLITATITSLTSKYCQESCATSDDYIVKDEFIIFNNKIKKVLGYAESKKTAVMLLSVSVYRKLINVGEKVMVLKAAINISKKWLQFLEDAGKDAADPKKYIKTFNKALLQTLTQLELVKAGLKGEKELWSLIGKPQDLVQKMYSLPCVLKSCQGLPMEADINSLADSVAQLHQLDLTQLRISLLDTWLLGTFSDSELDQTITFDVYPTEDESKDENIQRALYLLQSTDQSNCLDYLATIVNNTATTILSRKQALTCIVGTIYEKDANRLFEKSLKELRTDLCQLQQLCDLDQLGVTLTLDSLAHTHKVQLFQDLITSHKHQKKVVDLVVSMAFFHNVYDTSLWTTILDIQRKMGWLEDMRSVVSQLDGRPQFDQLPAFLYAQLALD